MSTTRIPLLMPCRCWVKFDVWEQCTLHSWSIDHIEYDEGPGHYATGIVSRGGDRPFASIEVSKIHLQPPKNWDSTGE